MYVKPSFSKNPGLLKIGTEMEICLVATYSAKDEFKKLQLVLYFIFCKYCIPCYVYIVHT